MISNKLLLRKLYVKTDKLVNYNFINNSNNNNLVSDTPQRQSFKPVTRPGRTRMQPTDAHGRRGQRQCRVACRPAPYNTGRPSIVESLRSVWVQQLHVGFSNDFACRNQAEVTAAIPLSTESRKRTGSRLEVSSVVLAAEAK